MEAKPAGAPDKVSVRIYLCGYPERIPATGKWKMANVTYRQHITLISVVLNGDCSKTECRRYAAMGAMRKAALKIRQGNGAVIVV